MKITNKWSQSSEAREAAKDARVFETDSGLLITSITDETDDAAVERFRQLIQADAVHWDGIKSQNEVWSRANEKRLTSLLDQAGIVNS
jgi:hypothetical protein